MTQQSSNDSSGGSSNQEAESSESTVTAPTQGEPGLAHHSVVYFIGSVLAIAGGIFMLPVYTHALTPGHYGLLETTLRFVSVCMVVGFLGLRQAYARFYFDDASESRRNVLTATVAISNFAVALFVMFPILAIVALLGKQLGIPELTLALSAILAIWLAFEATFMQSLTHLQVQVKSSQYVTAQCLRLATLLGINYVLLHTFEMELKGAIIGNLAAAVLGGTVSAFFLLRRSGMHFSPRMLKSVLGYGLPYIPTALFGYLMGNADRFSTILFGSVASLGLLALASKLGEMALMVFVGPIESVWSPYAFKVYDQPDGPRLIGSLYTRYTALCVLLALGISLAAPLAIKVLADDSYRGAAILVPIVALGWVFNIMATLGDIGILIAKKTHLKPRVAAAGAAIAITLQLLLTPRFGIVGAATGTALAYFLLYQINWAVSKRHYRMVTVPRDFLVIFCSAAGAYFSAHWVTQLFPSILGQLAGIMLGVLIYAIAINIAKIITLNEVLATARRIQVPEFLLRKSNKES